MLGLDFAQTGSARNGSESSACDWGRSRKPSKTVNVRLMILLRKKRNQVSGMEDLLFDAGDALLIVQDRLRRRVRHGGFTHLHGSRTGTELAVELSGPGAAPIYRLSPSVVNSTGMLTFETVPGLNLHVRRVLRTELSKSGLPVLCCMEALVTRPLARSTNTRQTPLPAMRRERASCG